MRAINHAMTGAIIGLSAVAPVAIPLAFFSHFAMDAIPHHDDNRVKPKTFRRFLELDILLCLVLVVILFLVHPSYWWLAIICAFLAASPHIMWFHHYTATHEGGKKPTPVEKRSAIVRLHHKVQWFQRPIGIIPEIVWGIATVSVLYFILK